MSTETLVLGGALFVSFFIVVWIGMSFYQKCPPNTAMIISGFAAADANTPFKIVIGRGNVVLPMIQVVNYLSLEVHKCALDLSSIYTSDGVPVAVKGSLQIKIGSDLVSIATACENFLGKSDSETCQIALDLIEKHLISTASKTNLSDFQINCQRVADEAAADSAPELAKLGITLVSLSVKSVEPVYQPAS